MLFRLAESRDIQQLVKMRWDFTYEHATGPIEAEYSNFEQECRQFLTHALSKGQWYIWVAEADGAVVSHIYIELVHKVPRPGRATFPFAYMTNVYTLPEYRSRGIGGQLLRCIEEWAKKRHLEFIMVWPSEEAIPFYARNGYKHCTEPMALSFE